MTKLDARNTCYERNERCKKCKHVRTLYTAPTPQMKILGCFCTPYHGKWVSEIEKCPLTEGIGE